MEPEYFSVSNNITLDPFNAPRPKCTASFSRDDLRFSIHDVGGESESLCEFSFKSDNEFTNLTHLVLLQSKEKRSEFSRLTKTLFSC